MIEYREFRAMNTGFLMGAQGPLARLGPAFEEVRRFVQESEARLTRFTDTSELAALNRSSGNWFVASDLLFQIVQEALDLHRETEGLFNPAVLDALERVGYDKSMDEIRSQGARDSEYRRVPAPAARFDQIELNVRATSIRLPPPMRIDLGGIAKGWVAEQAAARLAQVSTASVVDAGGDIFTIGYPEGRDHWEIALEDPMDPEKDLAVLAVGPGAVATSSVVKRRWMQGGQLRHHLIDPRRGEPALTDWLSVTALAPHAAVAEVYAKVLLIAGSHDAVRMAAKRPDVTYIAVDENGKLWGTTKSKEILNGGLEHTKILKAVQSLGLVSPGRWTRGIDWRGGAGGRGSDSRFTSGRAAGSTF